MIALSPEDVATRLKAFGKYRVVTTQQVVIAAKIPGFHPAHMLAIGLRETGLRNVIGGGTLLPNGKWIPETDPRKQDVGWLQFNRYWHAAELKLMPAVMPNTWSPTVKGKTAYDDGMVPRFMDALKAATSDAQKMVKHAAEEDVPAKIWTRLAIAAHNAGPTDAMRGYSEGDVDKYTTRENYSSWCVEAAGMVEDWLHAHPGWVAKPDNTVAEAVRRHLDG